MMSTRKRNGTIHGIVGRDRTDVSAQGTMLRSLIVERVEANSPAAQAGVQNGDVIVQVADQSISCALDLERALLDKTSSEHVSVLLRRSGGEQRVDLTLRAAERSQPSSTDVVWRKLGLRMKPVEAEVLSRVNQTLHGGLAVNEVNPEGPAAKAGIQRGDILVGLHQWETVTTDNVVFVLTHPDLASFNPLRFYIVRSGQVHRGWLQSVE